MASSRKPKASTPKFISMRKSPQTRGLSGVSSKRMSNAAKAFAKRTAKGASQRFRSSAPQLRGSSKQISDINKFIDVAVGYRGAKKKTFRSKKGNAAKRIKVEGRHIPENGRMKTGYWRITREPWMTENQWEAIKAVDKALRKKIYGKQGPGHKGYGTGEMQKWADYIISENKGLDPHKVSFLYWFKGAAEKLGEEMGLGDFNTVAKEMEKDPEHFLYYTLEKLQDIIPELNKMSKTDIFELVKHHAFMASYGPDGRAK